LWHFVESFAVTTAAQPEIRLRIDPEERAQFEQVGASIGMSANDMVKVFIKRTIAARGLPFEMKPPANDRGAVAERLMPIHGVPHSVFVELASKAARDAALGHVRAGRLAPLTPPASEKDVNERTP
jgi:addiction module RelB/DinJ family antitoxin